MMPQVAEASAKTDPENNKRLARDIQGQTGIFHMTVVNQKCKAAHYRGRATLARYGAI
jgi:hypothetical protein